MQLAQRHSLECSCLCPGGTGRESVLRGMPTWPTEPLRVAAKAGKDLCWSSRGLAGGRAAEHSERGSSDHHVWVAPDAPGVLSIAAPGRGSGGEVSGPGDGRAAGGGREATGSDDGTRVAPVFG